MDAKYYNGAPGDPYEFDTRPDDDDSCESCGAGPGEPCELMCSCELCDKRRQREMDEREHDKHEVA